MDENCQTVPMAVVTHFKLCMDCVCRFDVFVELFVQSNVLLFITYNQHYIEFTSLFHLQYLLLYVSVYFAYLWTRCCTSRHLAFTVVVFCVF